MSCFAHLIALQVFPSGFPVVMYSAGDAFLFVMWAVHPVTAESQCSAEGRWLRFGAAVSPPIGGPQAPGPGGTSVGMSALGWHDSLTHSWCLHPCACAHKPANGGGPFSNQCMFQLYTLLRWK